MKLETRLLGYGDVYEPWDRPALRSNKKIRPKNRPLPANVATCWEVNTGAGGLTCQQVTTCTPCQLFQQEKALTTRLRNLASNKHCAVIISSVPIRFRCDTPWALVPASCCDKKRKSEVATSEAASEPISPLEAAPSTPKRARTTRTAPVDEQESPSPIVPDPMFGPKVSPPTVGESAPPPDPAGEFTKYLLNRIDIQSQELESLGLKNETLTLANDSLIDENDWLHTTRADLVKMCMEVEDSKGVHVRQVKDLKLLLTTKVAGFMEEFAAVKTELNADKERNMNFWLSEVQAEKTMVAKLKAELEAFTMTGIPVPESIDDLAASIEQIVNCTTKKGTHLATKVKIICESVLTSVFDGRCLAYLMGRTLRPIQGKNPYRRAIEIAKIIDLSGSLINLSGYNALRKGVEGDADGKVERNGGWLASKYHVMKCMKAVETAAQVDLPLKPLILTDDIDGVQFEYDKLLAYLLKLYKLDDVAKNPAEPPVEFSITLDGADLSRNISHVTAGIKINDPRAIDPRTGIPIGRDGSIPVQSRELCFPCKILIAKDTKDLYTDHFTDFFAFFKGVEERGFGEYTRPFIVSSPQDLSSFWKSLKKGGACKVSKSFCHCCSIKSKFVHHPRPQRCEHCVEHNKEKCFHWEVGDTETLAKASKRLEAMALLHPHLMDATIKSKLNVRFAPNQMEATRDESNIAYCPQTAQERKRFSEEFLNHDLRILALPLLGSLEVRRHRLLSVLKSFEEAEVLQGTLEHGNYVGAFIGIRQAVPCILHLENRCGEKFLKMLFLEGYDKNMKTEKEKKKLLKDLEFCVNTQILGTVRRPANWRLATAKDSDSRTSIKDVTLPNSHCRKFVKAYKKLTELCILDDERRTKWNEHFELWNEVMETARKRDYFESQDVDDFQEQADAWYLKWHLLHGRDGISNYIHMISSGHIAFYMREWGNLYKYSQQGWESMNSLMKSVYYRRTQRGGNGGKQDEPNSRVVPIARWLQRKLYFLSGDYLKCDPDYDDGLGDGA
jgi:hypothetical protein